MKKEYLISLFIFFMGCAPAFKGKVISVPDGGGVENAVIKLQTREYADAYAEPVPVETLTDKRGKFVFKELTPGEYDMTVQKEGYMPQELTGLEISDQIKVREKIMLLRKATVSGMVFNPDGSPAANAEVLPDIGFASTSTYSDGTFILQYIEPGPNKIFAVSEKYASDPVEVNLQPGDNSLDIVMEEVVVSPRVYGPGIDKEQKGGLSLPLWDDGSQ